MSSTGARTKPDRRHPTRLTARNRLRKMDGITNQEVAMDEEFATPSPDAEPAAPAVTPRPRHLATTLFLLVVFMLGLWALLGYFHRFALFCAAEDMMAIEPSNAGLLQACYPYPWQKRQNDTLIYTLYGDIHAHSYHEQYAPLIQQHPHDRAYYAYYTLLGYKSLPHLSENELAARTGEQLDPDNALYDYTIARQMYLVAVKEHHAPDRSLQRIILDRPMLERLITEIRQGAQKSAYHGYQEVIAQAQSMALPSAQNWEGQLNRMAIRSSVMGLDSAFTIPGMDYAMNIRDDLLCLPWYADVLANEGRQSDAVKILSCWKPMVKQMTVESNTLLNVMVAGTMAEIARDQIPPAYRRLGRPDLADQTYREAKAICQPYEVFKDAHRSPAGKSYKDVFLKREAGGAAPQDNLAYFSNSIPITSKELAPTRLVEYVMVDELASGCLISLLMMLMVYFLLVASRWQSCIRKEGGMIDTFSLPLKQWIRIIGWGIGSPIVLYAIFSRLTPLGGRGIALPNHPSLFFVAWLVPTLMVLTALPLYLARRAFCHKCIEKGMVLPPRSKEAHWRFRGTIGATIIASLGAILLISLFLESLYPVLSSNLFDKIFPELKSDLFVMTSPSRGMILGVSASVLLFLFLLTRLPAFWERTKRQYSEYFGSLARSLAVACGVSLLIIIGILTPLLNIEERVLVRQDTLFFYQPGQKITSVTPIEARVAEHVRQEMLAAFADERK